MLEDVVNGNGIEDNTEEEECYENVDEPVDGIFHEEDVEMAETVIGKVLDIGLEG